MLTQERLKQIVRYEPETGLVIALVKRSAVYPGTVLGTLDHGYLRIAIDGRKYYVHQLAFLYMTGEIPVLIDHKNLLTTDNRWDNLRSADKKGNSGNRLMPVTNSSGVKGVSFCQATGKWRASIRINGCEKNLGRFNTIKEAGQAYANAALKHFGEFARTA